MTTLAPWVTVKGMKRNRTAPKLAHYPTPIAAMMANAGSAYRAKTVPSAKKVANKNACRGLSGRREDS